MTNSRPVLTPAAVPWSVATSASHLQLRQDANGLPRDMTFVGFFGYQSGAQQPSTPHILVARDPGAFYPDTRDKNAPYQMVRVAFDSGLAWRKNERFSEYEIVPQSAFDFSRIPGTLRGNEDALENLRRTDAYQVSTGLSPDPGFYEVLGSDWLTSNACDDCKQYLIVGEDEYYEIIALSWSWEIGQPA